jgi:hypothetical protein
MLPRITCVEKWIREGKAACWRLGFGPVACSIYIFTVRGSDNLKLSVDSAGNTISLLPV